QLALAVAVQGPAARTMSESLPPAGPSSRVVVASPTSKAPMSTSAPPARGNPAPRWSVVRLYGLWVVSRPASKAGLSAGRGTGGVGPPLLARGPRPKSAVVVVVLTPVGRPLLPVSRLLLPVTVLLLLTTSRPPLLLAKIVLTKVAWAPAAVPTPEACRPPMP